jgi:NAD(P)-dependent dehydrogenase (short-subunit alcohol dehydrogenase family)
MNWRAPLLEDKVALITGSGSGQGRAAAEAFAAHGASIAVIDIDDAGAHETVERIRAAGGAAIAVHADVSERAHCDKMVQAAVDQWGRLDVLYNNAAVQMSGSVTACTEDQWNLTIATNLSAIFWACRAALPYMLERGGSIINTASTLGLIGSDGFAAYGSAKAGLVALTRSIAVEHAPKVRANVIAPGSIDTPRFRRVVERTPGADQFMAGLLRNIPQKRLGVAEDVAGVALFLASDLSAYTSGCVVPVDGGLAALR